MVNEVGQKTRCGPFSVGNSFANRKRPYSTESPRLAITKLAPLPTQEKRHIQTQRVGDLHEHFGAGF